jgi:hypothetical protein
MTIFSGFFKLYQIHSCFAASLISEASNAVGCSVVRRSCLVLLSSAGKLVFVDAIAQSVMPISIFSHPCQFSYRFFRFSSSLFSAALNVVGCSVVRRSCHVLSSSAGKLFVDVVAKFAMTNDDVNFSLVLNIF